jgi:AbrB family looped-hinge helix DNA binding protein
MTKAVHATTTLSSKGQVILPKSMRSARRWGIGTRLVVSDTEDGILLREAPSFPSTAMEKVFGCLPYRGKTKTVLEMNEAIAAEVRRRHAGP